MRAPSGKVCEVAAWTLASVVLVACGGGGSSASVAVGEPEPAPTVAVIVPQPWPDDRARPDVDPRAPGYASRACGFDLDRDGVVGEAEDCRICDGSTTDVDDDGVDDRLVYVDCERGDPAGDGTAERPYASIAAAMDAFGSPVRDAVQAVCFRGRCEETVVPSTSGALGAVAADGFAHPSRPFALVGWDADADGAYPPFDEDDEAILDGSAGLDFGVVNALDRSGLELAHFTAVGFGSDCPTESGFLRPASGGSAVTQVAVHDLELLGVNRKCPAEGGRAIFLLLVEGSPLSFFSVSNVLVDGYGGDAVRGSGVQGRVLGPYRFEHLTVRPHGPVGGHARGIEIWGEVDGIEVLSSVFDADPASWSPCSSGLETEGCEPTYAIAAAPCTRGWTIRGNVFRDWKQAIAVRPDAGPDVCRTRDMDGIRIAGNRIRSDWEPWRLGDVGIRIDAGELATVLGLDVTDNVLSTSVGWESCIWTNVGVDGKAQDGLVRILDNQCIGPVNRYAALTVGAPDGEGGEARQPQHRYEIRDNLFAAIGTVNVSTGYEILELVAGSNVYDPEAGFSWAHDAAGEVTQETLAEWSALSGEDESSIACHAVEIVGAAVCR